MSLLFHDPDCDYDSRFLILQMTDVFVVLWLASRLTCGELFV